MRIISQNGTIHMPYDMCCVWRQEEVIYCRAIGSDDNVTMATYSSEDKAEKAVEMLRFAYIGMPIVMQNVDVSEDFAKEFERLNKCGVVVQAENQPSKVECINNAIFQFPQDDEIEVV